MSSRFPPFDNSLTEDAKVVKSFVDKIQEKIDNKILQKPEKKELKILESVILYPGAIIGGCVGVSAFFILRRGPMYVMNRILAKQHEKKHQSGVSKPPIYRESFAAKVIGSAFDAAFASLVGLSAWVISTNKEKALTEAARIPLVEGHSHISDALCDDFISIYSGIRPKFWKDYQDDTLTAIQTFVHNCEKRNLYKKKLKREMGLGQKYDVEFELPSRVPEDILEEEKDRLDGTDWASLEDFEEEPLEGNNDGDGTFWDGK